MDHLN